MKKDEIKIELELALKRYFEIKGSYNRLVYDSMYYSLSVGGKRIRPILFILTYLLYKDDYKEVLPIAEAIEMIHTYSLIHDDLPAMDDDDLRRNKPTNHKVFGDGIAILAGDALLNEAMNIMFDFCLSGMDKSIEACKLISNSSGAEGMIGGQVVDIKSEGKRIPSEVLYYMHSKKTGALIKASVVSGAILGGAPESEVKILSDFGDKLGLAFQIIDDILDVVGDKDVLGKSICSDENNNKTTFITLYGVEKCKELSTELTEECLELLSGLNRDTLELASLTKFLLKRKY